MEKRTIPLLCKLLALSESRGPYGKLQKALSNLLKHGGRHLLEEFYNIGGGFSPPQAVVGPCKECVCEVTLGVRKDLEGTARLPLTHTTIQQAPNSPRAIAGACHVAGTEA